MAHALARTWPRPSPPGLALAMSLFLLAQAGTPVTIGFLAKLGVIRAAIDADQWALAIVAMLTTVISTFMYLRIVVAMYFAESESESDDRGELRIPWGVGVTIGVAVIATLVLGVVPGPASSTSRTTRCSRRRRRRTLSHNARWPDRGSRRWIPAETRRRPSRNAR